MSLYAVEIDLDNRNTSHTQVVELVGADKRVLDVGCWTGDLGRVLQRRGCTVSGFEIDAEAAAVAAEHLGRVVVGNLDRESLLDHFEPGTFDAVVFADVLEHLYDPRAALEDAVKLLAPGGRVVISIPNITHGSVRLANLQGRWNYTDTGLLDRTHIRFWSRQGLLDFVASAGLLAEDLRGTLADPLRTEVEVDETHLPEHVVEWVRDQPDGLVYQFQLAATPVVDGGPTARYPELVPAADAAEVRLPDAFYEARLRAGRDALAMRDHVMGLQAQATSARERSQRLTRNNKRLKDELAEARRQLEERGSELARRRDQGLVGLARRVKRRLTS